MKSHIRLLSVTILLVSILVSGCKKDNPEVLPDPETLSFKQEEIINKLPDALKNSTSPAAQQVVAWVSTATNWSTFDSYFTPPENAVRVKASTVTYTWTDTYYEGSTISYWWTYTDDETTDYWKLEIQINDGPKAPYFESFEKKDGSAGQVKYSFEWANYDAEEEYNGVYWIYSYEINDAGDYSFTWLYESDSEEYENFLRYDVIVKADGSGIVDYQSYGELIYHAEWDALGNGSYSYYSDGEVVSTESWTVG